jgi:hypothetical protein
LHTYKGGDIFSSVPACGQGPFSHMYPLLRLICGSMLVGLYTGSMSVISSLLHPLVASSRALLHREKRYHFLTYRGLTCTDLRPVFVRRFRFIPLYSFVGSSPGVSLRCPANAPIIHTAACVVSVYDPLAEWLEVSMVASVWSSVQRGRPVLVKSGDQPRRSRSYATGGILLLMRL